MELVLPWPPKELNPNSRVHWAAKANAVKKYRRDCYLLTKVAGLSMPSTHAILVTTFYPPSNRRRDDDNLVAAFKAGRDGIAEAMGVDDSRLRVQPEFGDVVKGGRIEILLRGIA
jgi:crossover junction endodeoxyribonuclease RusA